MNVIAASHPIPNPGPTPGPYPTNSGSESCSNTNTPAAQQQQQQQQQEQQQQPSGTGAAPERYIPFFLSREAFELRVQDWWKATNIQCPFPALRLPVPGLGYPPLHDLYTAVVRLGGYRVVTRVHLWPEVLASLLQRLAPAARAGSCGPAPHRKFPLPTLNYYSSVYATFLCSFEEHVTATTRQAYTMAQSPSNNQCMVANSPPAPNTGPGPLLGQPWNQNQTRRTFVTAPSPAPPRISPLACLAHMTSESLRAIGLPELLVGEVEMHRSALQRQKRVRHQWKERKKQHLQQLVDRELAKRMHEGADANGQNGAESQTIPPPPVPLRVRRAGDAGRETPRYTEARKAVKQMIDAYLNIRAADPLPVLHLDQSEMVQIVNNFQLFSKLSQDIYNILPLFLYLSNNVFFTKKLVEIVSARASADLLRRKERY